MPRTVPTGLLASSSRCAAVLIARADGTKFGLTDATVPFTYDGVYFQTTQGGDASQVAQEVGNSIDNMEVSTILNDAINYVKGSDVVGTRYENSRWTLFEIDYLNPGNGAMILQQFRLAKANFTDTRMTFELLGLLSFLKQDTGRELTVNCDVLRFGDKRCDPSQTLRASLSDALTVLAVQSNVVADFVTSSRAAQFYSFGDATWSSGLNNGLVTLIKIHTIVTPGVYASGTTYSLGQYVTYGGHTYYSLSGSTTGQTPPSNPGVWQMVSGNPTSIARINWRKQPPYPVAVGDSATLCFGCDRRKATCETVIQTSNPSGTNVESFRGFYLPSQDQMLVVGRPSS